MHKLLATYKAEACKYLPCKGLFLAQSRLEGAGAAAAAAPADVDAGVGDRTPARADEEEEEEGEGAGAPKYSKQGEEIRRIH